MSTKLKILPVKCGDAFVISQRDAAQKVRHIIIDGGYINAYNALDKQIKAITKKDAIDLWILTHLDADHINGAVKYLRDQAVNGKGKFLKKVWFNFFNGFTVNDDSPFLSYGKGFVLTKLLRDIDVKGRQDITSELKPVRFGDAELVLLSPDRQTFDELKAKWKTEYKKYYGAEPPVHLGDPSAKDAMTIAKLSKRQDVKEDWSDKGLANRSSIAFIYKENKKCMLMLGDSYPSLIVKELSADYSKKKPLKAKFMKLSHHGSARNYSGDLLDIIKCRRFIISTDGENQHGLPDKEVLAKILTHPNRDKSKKITFYFSHNDSRLRKLFNADPDAEKKYNFRCKYPEGKTPLTVNL